MNKLFFFILGSAKSVSKKADEVTPFETAPTSMHNTNAKIIRTTTTATADLSAELNGNRIIFLRGTKATDNGHILVRSDLLTSTKTTNLVLDDSDGKIFIQGDAGEGVFLQSVKRLDASAPILLLGSNDNGNGHILIQTAGEDSVDYGEEQTTDNILVRALEGLQEGETTGWTLASTPLSSGRSA